MVGYLRKLGGSDMREAADMLERQAQRIAELEAVNIELQRQGEATELDRLKLQARVAELEEELGRDQLRLKEEAQETVRLQEIIIAELENKQ